MLTLLNTFSRMIDSGDSSKFSVLVRAIVDTLDDLIRTLREYATILIVTLLTRSAGIGDISADEITALKTDLKKAIGLGQVCVSRGVLVLILG